MFAIFLTVLCLMSVGHSAPLACEKLVQPFDEFEPRDFLGRWALVAGSLKDRATADDVRRRDSVTIYLYNSSYTQVNLVGSNCGYYSTRVSMESHVFEMKVNGFNMTATFLNTSCPDCAVITLDIESPGYKTMEVYLFSKRRQLEKNEMEEFMSQVECLNMPPLIVMDPTKKLCPEVKEGLTGLIGLNTSLKKY